MGKTKEKAKCPYFELLYGYPKRYGITCWIPEEQRCTGVDFSKDAKEDRDKHFREICCGNIFYMCGCYPVKYPNGWLHPDGQFFQSPYCQHGQVAMWLEEKLKLKPQFNDFGSIVHGEELLEVLGWIKLYASPTGTEGHIFMSGRLARTDRITDKQVIYLESVKDKMIGSQMKDYYDLINDSADAV